MKIALAQINPTIGDFSGNFRLIAEGIDQARGLGCQLVVFPEMATTGYPPRDLLEERFFVRQNLEGLKRLISSARGIGVVLGYVDTHAGRGRPLHNAAMLFEDGKVLARTRKMLLPTYDVFDEPRYFEPGRRPVAFTFRGLRLGLTICEDIWGEQEFSGQRLYRRDPVRRLAGRGVEVLINISASPYHLGKRAARREVLSQTARHHGFPVIYVNQVGGNDELIFDGNSLAMGADGRAVAHAADFAPDLVVFDTDTGTGDMRQVFSPSPDEELRRALVLGLRDYARKCGFSSAVLGLSGGVDSSLVASLAVSALSAANVTGVLMPSPYTSGQSIRDATALAANLGIRTLTIPITTVFSTYLDALAPAFAGRAPDTTEENIQARIRGNLLMALSNKHGHLLLSTGNKSELAVGYCTLYGDMSGGLAVISDVPKTLVYRLAHHLNDGGEVIPAPVLTRPPTAELRPGQTDQESLPPYEILDPILRLYVEERLGPAEIASQGYDLGLVEEIVARVRRNEYKRWQAAPGLKVTSKAFGYGRRYPIAQAT
ncbi:MAG: NAD+ synthase [Pseudomonadota bacterium]